ncbi:YbaY family lipoprotein [Planctomicrobium sp. SH668]|uniref:YbaY family lipoprotein n=1 Tax=Planctomicrobium sp. SH668 TaxID=3448126 RepID=UPI003F5BFB05
MKRISLAATLLAGYFAIGADGIALAVDPNVSSRYQLPGQVTPQSNNFDPAYLPGQNYFNNTPGGTQSLDPFYNPGIYNPNIPGINPNYPGSPTYPGQVTPSYVAPGTGTGVNPNLNDRTRLNPQYNPGYVPPGSQNPNLGLKKWRLGIMSKDTDTGVQIHTLVNGGAAQRAGLEPNDRVISVNGYQVGYVNGQLFDCATEFDRSADQNGWVTLLVQNSRDRSLVNVPVQLDSRLATLSGSIAVQNRQNLPANAVVNVELREVVGSRSTPVTIASRQIENLTTYPIPFTIDYDPANLNVNGRYQVYANVLSNGREIFRTSQVQQVPMHQGAVRTVALQLDQVQGNVNYPTYPTGPQAQDAQVAQIVKWFNDYLGRQPSDRELVAWMQQIQSGVPMSQVQLALLSNDQFFNRYGNNRDLYVAQVIELLLGRKPYPEDMAYWTSRYEAQNGIRRNFVSEFQGALGIN